MKPYAMENLGHAAQLLPAQQRKHRRFNLQYPVCLNAHSADCTLQVEAMSRNISIRGLLVETSSVVPQHTPVSFIVSVEHGQVGRPIQFVGEGKVVRVDSKAAEDGCTMRLNVRSPSFNRG